MKPRLTWPVGARIGGLVLLVVSLIGCDAGLRDGGQAGERIVVAGQPDNADYMFGRDRQLALAVTAAAARAARPIYRHSVIRGGAYSAEELVKATEKDPVVFAEYGSAVQRAPVRIATSPRPRRVYMSYRIGDQIYWTRTKALLNAGEMTLTNGDIEIRARCGNQISETEMFPVAENEPDAVEFDNLVADEPALLASTPEVQPVPGVSPGMTPPAIWATVPTIPLGVPGGGSYAPGVPGGAGGSSSAGIPATGARPNPSGAPPTVIPPGDPDVPSRPPVGNPPPTTGGPPGGDGPQPPTPPLDPPEPPFVPDPPGPPFVPDDNHPPTPDDDVPTVTPVPEPGTFVLLGSAVAGLIAMRFRQRARQGASTPPPG